jgi:hypothetical protein
MTVAELKNLIEELPDDMEIILRTSYTGYAASKAEGADYSINANELWFYDGE